MCRTKRTGPRTEPSGTPYSSLEVVELDLEQRTHCELSLRYEANQLMITPFIPYDFSNL